MKKLLLFLSISILTLTLGQAQTSVSGGIFSNTTWTLAGSPYIVTDTVVVFPGVTLTIQPGVTVKFADNKRIEFRQAKLKAIGTSIDSITFTSNSLSPAAGIYPGIFLNGGTMTSKVSYCDFKYANIGINANISDSLIVSNSFFNNNIDGLLFMGNTVAQVALVNNCVFNNNTNGLALKGIHYSSVNYCNFSYNSTNGFIIDDMDEFTMTMTVNHCNFYNNGDGIWSHMHYLTINNSNFLYNNAGWESVGYLSPFDTYNNTTKNSVFNYNQTGLLNIGRTLIDSCTMSLNQTGKASGGRCRVRNCTSDSNSVLGIGAYTDSIINCTVRYNGAGITAVSTSVITRSTIEYNTGTNINGSGNTTITANSIRSGNIGIDVTGISSITKNIIENNNLGINLSSSTTTISCNKICNNTTYDLKYLSSSNINAINNYWCTTDSASTEAVIYDGYDNISYGLVNFMPMDPTCYLTGGVTTGIIEASTSFSFNIFPNPATNNLTIELPESISKTSLQIFNTIGELIYSATTSNEKTDIDISSFASGIYVIQIADSKNISRKKFIKQ